MDRCPNCRARYDGNDTCRRCGMDLDLLLATERAAEHWLLEGIARLTAADPDAAEHALRQSLALRRDALVESLLEHLMYPPMPAAADMAPTHSKIPALRFPFVPDAIP